jgi:glucosyl-dolichyl phosphate glucuronosyltransferase
LITVTDTNISLIICTYNRVPLLEQALRTVVAQTASDGLTWEALIVDNRSTDGTAEIARRFAEQSGHIRYVREEQQGLSHARNRGIAEATGELLCFIDDDVLLPPDYVARAWQAWKSGTWGVAGGRAIGNYEMPCPAWATRLPPQMLNGPFGLHNRGPEDFILDEADDIYPIGANMLIPQAAIEQIGGFNTDLGRSGKNLRSGEDSDLYDRARRAGMKIGYCGSCELQHFVAKERLTRRFFVRWKFASALTGAGEPLPENTVLWLRVPRFDWRALLQAALTLPFAAFTARRMEALIRLSGALGTAIGYLTGRRRATIPEDIQSDDC